MAPVTQDLHCKVCRKEIDMCAADGSALWCEKCCEDHDYEYDPDRRDRFCKHCDALIPADFYECEDNVSISFAGLRNEDRSIGTPISDLSGRPVPEGHPDSEKYERFVAVAKSWGYN